MLRYVIMDKILYWLVMTVFTLLSWLPLRVHYFISDLLYILLYKILRYRYDVVITNISRSFPEMNYKGVKRVAKDFYHSLCDMIVETVWAYTRSSEKIGRHVDFSRCDTLNEAYGEGRNVIVVMGHQPNWELYTALPHLERRYGLKMDNRQFHFIYKKMSSRVADMVIRRLRLKHNSCSVVEKEQIARHLLRNRNEGGVYFLIADQYPGKGASVEMDFLHQPTIVFNGAEELARKLSLPVVFVSIERKKRGHYNAEFTKICDDASKFEEGFVTGEYIRLLEDSINKNRSNWLWSHRRWK